ncbi:hypothetical protein [Vibrio sp. HN007]|uniref:hypothetical protein n=1 Tax=Vibrio iocasae TaxID=3098914 RepID=UPI0035D47427
MPKYQFFTFPHNQTADFTYLDMSAEDYLQDKQALLEQNFELDGHPITAENPKEAVKKYNRDFSRVTQEQAKGNLMCVLFGALMALSKWVRKKASN